MKVNCFALVLVALVIVTLTGIQTISVPTEKGEPMKVILEIDEAYSSVLTITAVGGSVVQTRVSVTAVDLGKTNHLKLRNDGRWIDCQEDFEGDE